MYHNYRNTKQRYKTALLKKVIAKYKNKMLVFDIQ